MQDLDGHNINNLHDSSVLQQKCNIKWLLTGELCEERVDPCLSHPCTEGSTCDALPQGGYVCKCPPGRKGNLCQDCKYAVQKWDSLLIPNSHDFTCSLIIVMYCQYQA